MAGNMGMIYFQLLKARFITVLFFIFAENNFMKRCQWSVSSDRMIRYHDTEWGVPCHDPDTIFEFLSLDIFQAGLSWSTILNKRENFQKAFHNFHIQRVAEMDINEIEQLLTDKGIVRNRQKIEAVIHNAQIVLQMANQQPFEKYIWQFTGHQTRVNEPGTIEDIPATSGESDAMSKQMKKDGFKFVGSTICYAFMQSIGMVNDHTTDCFRKNQIAPYGKQ
jgi:DNA-3-methyladenine glycosylase I